MDVSIIIPCYNHGAYIKDAIHSVVDLQLNISYEIIVIDDGSTDPYTKNVLKELSSAGYTVIEQENLGLATARNNGIQLAKGKFILPLDSDNKIHQNYLTKAYAILVLDSTIDVVYGNPYFFGDEEGLRKVGEFSITNLLGGNYIDACALFRKCIWEKVGGYDAAMPVMGNEDWELWINAYFCGARFYYLDDVCFYYRTSGGSMTMTKTRSGYVANRHYIYQKHGLSIVNLLRKERTLLNEDRRQLNYIKKHPFKAFIKGILKMSI